MSEPYKLCLKLSFESSVSFASYVQYVVLLAAVVSPSLWPWRESWRMWSTPVRYVLDGQPLLGHQKPLQAQKIYSLGL